jgi:hypothetical protein
VTTHEIEGQGRVIRRRKHSHASCSCATMDLLLLFPSMTGHLGQEKRKIDERAMSPPRGVQAAGTYRPGDVPAGSGYCRGHDEC